MRRTIAAVGRSLVTIGLLILLFVAYELWGTGILQARAQDRLRSQLSHELRRTTTTTPASTTAPGATTSSTAPAATTTTTAPATVQLPTFQPGDALGRIVIGKIGVNQIFVAGTARSDLEKGPGHYPGTPIPGQVGNAAIAGHRTTHGAPFYRLNELVRGDVIGIQDVLGTFNFRVTQTLVVAPTDVSVVDNTPDTELTLTTCNPRYSAAQRLVVKAKLIGPETKAVHAELPGGATTMSQLPGFEGGATSLASGLSGDEGSLRPAVLFGLLAALVGLGWWWAFRRWRHWATWLVGMVPFLGVLFFFYVYLERVLPAGY